MQRLRRDGWSHGGNVERVPRAVWRRKQEAARESARTAVSEVGMREKASLLHVQSDNRSFVR